MVEVKNLSFAYGEHEVLRDISFTASKGEYLAILGCNGVGKSTLFKCVLGLLHGYSGQVLIDGVDIKSLTVKQLAHRVAYIPQASASSFNYSVEDIVLMGTTSRLGAFSSPRENEKKRCEWALSKVGITHLKDRCFHHISGGERQLVIIARALAQDAKILMLDEPTASLDYGNQMLVLSQAKQLSKEGYTVIQTTHNLEHSFMFCDTVLALKGGELLAYGKPKELMNSDMITKLYGVDVEVSSLFDDRVRVCTPKAIAMP